MTKNLNETEALYCANIFNNYFGKFDRIDQYMRDQKLAQIENVPAPLPGMGFDTDMFSNNSLDCWLEIHF